MSQFKRIYRDLTLNAYTYNKAAKTLNQNFYKTKAKLILESLKTIKRDKISSIKYEIKKDGKDFLVCFTFMKKDIMHKSVKFHLPRRYEGDLWKYMTIEERENLRSHGCIEKQNVE